jgi:hypothetical protein
MKNTSAATLLILLAGAGLAMGSDSLPKFPEAYGYVDGADFHFEREIAPGITHRFDSFSTGPLTINTVILDMGRPDLTLEVEKGNDDLYGNETVTAMVKRLADPKARPLVAINADFWATGHVPVGPFVDEGMVWKGIWREPAAETPRTRSVFAFDDQHHFHIGLPDLSFTLRGTDPGQTFGIECVNVTAPWTDIVLYTWPGTGGISPPTDPVKQIVLSADGDEWLPNAPITVTVDSIGGRETSIANKSTFLLHTSQPPEWIKEGAQLTLSASFANLPGKILGMSGGLPRLLENGRVVVETSSREEGAGKSFATDLHPRTAIGMRPDGRTLVLAVVDGRQPRRSVGINLYDLAAYMQSMGCDRAMNLDGGGSSTMVAGNQLVNFPSDAGGPRAVSNAIVFRRTAPLGEPTTLTLVPSRAIIPTGGAIEFQHEARDASGEIVPLDTAAWPKESLSVSRGSFTALGARSLSVTGGGDLDASLALASADGTKTLTGEAHLTAVDPVALAFTPPLLLVNEGDEEDVLLRATAPEGTSYHGGYTVPGIEVPPFLQYDQATRTLKAVGKGKGIIRARLGKLEARLPVAVGEYDQRSLLDFDTLVADPMRDWIVYTNANKDGSNITLDKDNKKEGAAAWRFDYAMAKGGTTKLALPLNVAIPRDAAEIGLWIYGDGNQHWLRAELKDSRGETYLLDMTTSKAGIFWENEWKFVTASLAKPAPRGRTKTAAVPPLTLETLYIVQPQEAAKKDGSIWLDGLGVLDLPADLKAEMEK